MVYTMASLLACLLGIAVTTELHETHVHHMLRHVDARQSPTASVYLYLVVEYLTSSSSASTHHSTLLV